MLFLIALGSHFSIRGGRGGLIQVGGAVPLVSVIDLASLPPAPA